MNTTQEIIASILEKNPDLNYFGFGLNETRQNMEKMSEADKEKKHSDLRQKLIDSGEEFERVCNWLKDVKSIKSINRKYSSYGLKHIVENDGSHSYYIANGSFIAAAIHMGFKFERCSYDSPNAFFNFSSRSIPKVVRA